MKYVFYELKKLFSIKYFTAFSVLMLIVNIIAANMAADDFLRNNPPAEFFADFFDLYLSDPDKVNADYEEYLEEEKRRDELILQAHLEGNDEYEPLPIPSKYSVDPRYGDLVLYKNLYDNIDYIGSYSESMREVINNAERNLRDFEVEGIGEDTYSYKYQLKVIDLYEKAENEVRLGFEYPHGWEEYFSFDVGNIFIFALLLMAGTLIFMNDKSSGMMFLLRTTKNGRNVTAAAKYAVMIIFSIVTVIAFSLSTFAVFGLKIGYGSPYNAIQIYSSFKYCPYVLTVAEYFLISIAVKCLVFSAVASVILAVSAFTGNYVFTYIIGLGIFGVNFLMKFIQPNFRFQSLRYLNFLSAAKVTELFSRYRSLNLFGNVVGYVPLTLALSAAVILIFAGLFIFKFSRQTNSVTVNRSVKLQSTLKKCFDVKLNKTHRKKRYASDLWKYEFYKLYSSKGMLLMLVVLLLMKCFISDYFSAPAPSISESVYKEYMKELSGEYDDGKREMLANIRNELNMTIGKKDEMQLLYKNGDIDYEEYTYFINEYYTAQSKSEVFGRVEKQAEHLDFISYDMGVSGKLVYDTGWKVLFGENLDVTLYAALLLSFSGIFAREYDRKTSSGGFADIMKTTKKGRRHTFSAKMRVTALMSLAIAAIWNAADLLYTVSNYELPLYDAPVLSIEKLYGAPNVSILQFAVIFYVTKIASAVLFSLFVAAVSELARKYTVIMTVTVSATLLPFLLSKFDAFVPEWIDFTRFMNALPVLTSDEGYLNIALFTAATLGVFCFAKKRWRE